MYLSEQAYHHRTKYKSAALVIVLSFPILSFQSVQAENNYQQFIDDSTLTGNLVFFQRQRDRKDVLTDKYEKNLHHATGNAIFDFSSGYFADVIGIDLGVLGSVEFNQGGPTYPSEIGFSNAKTRWDEKEEGDTSGVSYYKAALKTKFGPLWIRGGHIQPTGQTLLSPQWSFVPGTYRGVEAGMKFDYDDTGALAFSYMWADRYKAPWYRNLYGFRQGDYLSPISYLHSFGASYDFKNGVLVEAAMGQARKYMNQYFAKVGYQTKIQNNPFNTSYQFYGADDRADDDSFNDAYDGLAWMQGLTFGYKTGPFDWRLEGTWVRARGNQGYFLQRMTKRNSTSNGRLDIGWDARSDFNADNEKSVYAGISYGLAGWELPEWTIGTAYVYAWGAKPNKNAVDPNRKIKESAVNFDVKYQILEGRAKGTFFALHYTIFDNHSDIPSWGGGFDNIFQDEKDIKFTISVPLSFF